MQLFIVKLECVSNLYVWKYIYMRNAYDIFHPELFAFCMVEQKQTI